MGADATRAEGDLHLRALTKAFGDFTAVDDITLTVPQGSFFALLGPSGCGKTTTLRMVAGLEEPTSGSISIGDADITYTKPYQRPVNTVFQNYALFPHLDIYENVAFGLRRRKVRGIDAEVAAALDLVELGHVARRKPGQLSGGQQQRIALARAIVNRPAVLLLDEPLGALDLKLRRQMQVELKHIQTEVGLTFIHVTHDQEEAMTMADTVAVMNNGAIEQMGSPIDLYEAPRTAFVANFLGQSNLFPASITAVEADDVVLHDADGTFRVPRSRAPEGVVLSAGTRVLVGVRPEKISIAQADGAAPAPAHGNFVDGVVSSASFTGVSTQYEVQTRGGDSVAVFVQNTVPGGVLAPGAEVRLTWPAEFAFILGGDEDPLAGASTLDGDGL